MELTGTGGPVNLTPTTDPWALKIERSARSNFEGFNAITSDTDAVLIDKSNRIIFSGPSTLATPRYTIVSAGDTAVHIRSKSRVTLGAIAMSDSGIGLSLENDGGRRPRVVAEGVAFTNNEIAGKLTGGRTYCKPKKGPSLDILGDFNLSWLNYVMNNVEGFLLSGSAILNIDHTVMGGNLHRVPSYRSTGYLFELNEASRLVGRNLAVYNNDMDPNAGISTAWSTCVGPCINTPGKILHHETCDEAIFESSSFVDNQTDLVFHLDYASGAGSGRLTLDHVMVANSWGKVLSESSFFSTSTGCAAVNSIDSYLWDNRVDVDPASCMPADLTNTWDPLVVSTGAPASLSSLPDIPTPLTSLYLMTSLEPTPGYPHQPDLYKPTSTRNWTVDGTTIDDLSEAVPALDVGYHNPM